MTTHQESESTLQMLLLSDMDNLQYLYSELMTLYSIDPTEFADIFFDLLPDIDPKVVRLVAYLLDQNGVNMEYLYSQKSPGIPEFLFNLNTVPNSTISTLLRYKFPPYPDSGDSYTSGNIFFWWSLDKTSQVDSKPSNLDWLDFILDQCIHLSIDLNRTNEDTGQTLIQRAVDLGSHPLTLLLLSHRLDPNRVSTNGKTALDYGLDLFNQAGSLVEETRKIYLNLIRQLIRYRADLTSSVQDRLLTMDDRKDIELNIRIGKELTPEYVDHYQTLFSLDDIEDLTLAIQLNPQLIESEAFTQRFSHVNKNLLFSSVNDLRDRTKVTEGKIVTWPTYIDQTKSRTTLCPVSKDTRPKVDNPPSSDQVYQMALIDLPNITNKEIRRIEKEYAEPKYVPQPDTPAAPTPFSTSHISIQPLPKPPIVPTSAPGLPILIS